MAMVITIPAIAPPDIEELGFEGESVVDLFCGKRVEVVPGLRSVIPAPVQQLGSGKSRREVSAQLMNGSGPKTNAAPHQVVSHVDFTYTHSSSHRV